MEPFEDLVQYNTVQLSVMKDTLWGIGERCMGELIYEKWNNSSTASHHYLNLTGELAILLDEVLREES